jgi:S1-C subfamily serine protease
MRRIDHAVSVIVFAVFICLIGLMANADQCGDRLCGDRLCGDRLCGTSGDSPDAQTMVDSYVEVRQDATGAGVVIAVDGEELVLTARHCVENDRKCVIRKITEDYTQEVYTEGVVVLLPKDEKVDLALVKPSKPLKQPAARYNAVTPVKRGQDVWYVGTPKGMHSSLEKSIVNVPCRRHQASTDGYLVVNGIGWYGNSGGPAFVKDAGGWTLVGILVRLYNVENARTPVCCETLPTIHKVLDEYRKSKEERK